MKYIEFLGLPGSGKTTVAKEVVSILRAKQNIVLTRWNAKHAIIRIMAQKKAEFFWRSIYRLTYVVKSPVLNLLWGKYRYSLLLHFIRQYPQLVQQVVECAERVAPPPMLRQTLSSEQLLLWFFDVACIYQAAQEYLESHDVLLMEEGFYQQSYYLTAAFRKEALNDQQLARYVQLIPEPQLLIALFADPGQCEKRLQTRTTGIPSKILRSLTVSERIALLKHRMNTYQKIAEYLEKRNIPVIRLNNNNSSRSTRKILEEQLAYF